MIYTPFKLITISPLCGDTNMLCKLRLHKEKLMVFEEDGRRHL
jgi:hypothetical protein